MPVREIIERTTIREIDAAQISIITCTPADPFLVDDPCPYNGGGPHYDIVVRPEIVCIHCARVVWQ